MALFSRRRSGSARPSDDATGRFWSWWSAGGRQEAATALAAGDGDGLARVLAGPVAALHPDLMWHAGPGSAEQFRLVLSGVHHPSLRTVTERWRVAGPPDGDGWEYHAAAPAEPDLFSGAVLVDGVELEPGKAVAGVSVDDARFRIDVSVHHPLFGELPELTRSRIAHVLVVWALGEDDAERWVGRISASAVAPLDGVPVSVLGALASQLGDRWGGERWAVLEGQYGRDRLLAAVRCPLRRVDHPLLDEHVSVRLGYADRLPDGLPGEHALGDLVAFEQALSAHLGGDALLVAHETASGERVLHYYADSQAHRADTIREALGGWTAGPTGAHAEADPGWDGIAHLLV